MHDDAFRQLLISFHRSWRGYRKVRKGVKRRLSRHMQDLGCRTMSRYLEVLQGDAGAMQECEQRLTVSISRFFRDYRLWECLRREIFPSILADSPQEVTVWSAGCARGEEVYSIKILWDQISRGKENRPALHVLASDICDTYLKKGQEGVFENTSLREVPNHIRQSYFEKRGKKWAVSEVLKKDIVWETGDLVRDLPKRHFDLVCLRNNVLTYYDDSQRVPAFRRVVGRIRIGGFLVIGSHEAIVGGPHDLVRCGCHPCIFRKTGK